MRDTLTIGKNTDQQYSSVFFERALDADFLLFSDIREAAKQFQSVDICCGKKSTNMLACEQTHSATDSKIDVKNSRK